MPERFAENEKNYMQPAKGCFACGVENEFGLKMKLYRVGAKVYCDYAVPRRYQGFSRTVHGGIIACLFDELTVSGVSFIEDEMCVTLEMTITYRKPVLVEKPIQLRVWVVERNGRKIHGHGEIVDENDDVLAEADTKMLALDAEKAKRFMSSESADKMKEKEQGDA